MKKVKPTIILIFLLVFVQHANSQQTDSGFESYLKMCYKQIDTNNFFKLTKAQMLEDLDYFKKTIENNFPFLIIKSQVEKYDVLYQIETIKELITEKTTSTEFIWLLEKALISCQDPHLYLPILLPGIPMNYGGMDAGISEEAKKMTKYYNIYLCHYQILRKFDLELCYIDGNYYTVLAFKKNGIDYPAGLKLIECNGNPIHTLVATLSGERAAIKWDKINKRHYSLKFFEANNLQNDSIKLIFEDRQKNSYKVSYSMTEPIDYIEKPTNLDKPIIEFFKNIHTLYIRIPIMNNINVYIDTLNNFTNKHLVKFLILDIRGNGGGNDNVWKNIISYFYKNEINRPLKMAFNNLESFRKSFSNFTGIDTTFVFQRQPITELNDIQMYSIEDNEIIPAQNDGFDNTDKIFIFADDNCYSSSLALTSFAINDDKIYSIGIDSGWIGGAGTTPVWFELPNSKMIFQMELFVDYSNIKTLEDFYTPVEYKLKLTPQYFHSRKTDWKYSYNYLKKNDPYFKQFLKLIKPQSLK